MVKLRPLMTPGGRGCGRTVATFHVQQDSAGLGDDERAGSQVPHVHADLVVGLHAARRHQTHVDGGRPGATHAGDTQTHTLGMQLYGFPTVQYASGCSGHVNGTVSISHLSYILYLYKTALARKGNIVL